jgi:hypothetical protein
VAQSALTSMTRMDHLQSLPQISPLMSLEDQSCHVLPCQQHSLWLPQLNLKSDSHWFGLSRAASVALFEAALRALLQMTWTKKLLPLLT